MSSSFDTSLVFIHDRIHPAIMNEIDRHPRLQRAFSWLLNSIAILFILLVITAWRHAELQTPTPSYLVLDKHHTFVAQIQPENNGKYGYWPLTTLPERVVAATLALEDQRFWRHPGVDFLAIGRAALQNIRAQARVSGASTLAMQISRLQTNRPRTYLNKAIDAFSALLMTYRYGRTALLKHYLLLAPYGNGAHGVVYAARRYFDKPVADLSWAEIALLCAIPQAPSLMNPYHPAGLTRAKKRGARMLRTLLHKAVINTQEYQVAQQHLRDLRITAKPNRPTIALHAILQLEKRLRATRPTQTRIVSSLDLLLQQDIHTLAATHLHQWRAQAAEQTALIVTKRDSNQVLAWLGSTDYFASHGAIDFTQVPRSPGSTLKPFLFAQALAQEHIKPNTLLDDLQGVSWGFNNADRRFLGPLSPRQALANSRNIPAINLLRLTGLQNHYGFLHQLGLHQHQRPARYYGLGLALGNMAVSLAQLNNAYHVLANDGALTPLSWLENVTHAPTQALSANAARQITLFLSDPIARLPSFKRMGATEYPFPVAVKTGTSQNFRDAWAMAYSKDYLVSVWVGRADAKPMQRLGGANSAARLAQAILFQLHPVDARGLTDLSFPPPEQYVAREICALDGKFSRDCQRTFIEWFPPEQAPQVDRSFDYYTIDSRNQLLATQWTPQQHQKSVRFLKLPDKYRNWAIANRLPTPPHTYSPLDLPTSVSLSDVTAAHAPHQQARPILLTIQSPKANSRIFLTPDTPAALQTLALQVQLEHSVEQVLWVVDDAPYQLANAPYAVRWPLSPGAHTFQVKIPYREDQSEKIRIVVEQ